jgi:hypothetical protein
MTPNLLFFLIIYICVYIIISLKLLRFYFKFLYHCVEFWWSINEWQCNNLSVKLSTKLNTLAALIRFLWLRFCLKYFSINRTIFLQSVLVPSISNSKRLISSPHFNEILQFQFPKMTDLSFFISNFQYACCNWNQRDRNLWFRFDPLV